MIPLPHKPRRLPLFLLYLGLTLLVVVILYAFFLYTDYKRDREVIARNELVQVALARKSIVHDFSMVGGDLSYLLSEPFVKRYLNTPNDATRRVVEQALLDFVEHKRIYAQVRFIDAGGMERIRLDLHGDRGVVATEDQLQDKSGRYYFAEAIGLMANEVYVSPLDLNVEHGEIEHPFKPMIRLATPLFNDRGERFGVLVLNFDAEPLLKNFDDMVGGSFGHIALLNDDGYWLRSHEHEREWGFMLAHGQNISDLHGEIWRQVRPLTEGQLITSSGIYSHTHVFPLVALGSRSLRGVGRDHYRWHIISVVPPDVLHGMLWSEMKRRGVVLLIAFMVIGIPLSWVLATHTLERRRMSHELKMHADVFDATTDGVIITDASSVIVSVNDAFCRLTGYSEGEAVGQSPKMLYSPRQDEDLYQEMWEQLQSDGEWQGEVWNRRKDGESYLEWLRATAVCNRHGNAVSYVWVMTDITRRRQEEDRLHYYAHHDALTGLPNRLLLDDRIDQALTRARRNDTRVALLYIDLDRFKPVNDTYGHEAGDIVLCEVANRMLYMLRESDTVARLGGDEFIVVLGDESSLESIEEVARRVLALLQKPLQYHAHQFSVGGSIGVAVYPDDAETKEELASRADAAMYVAKRSRNTYILAQDLPQDGGQALEGG